MVSIQDKKEMIFDAAYSLFLERGYTNTKIIDIAEHAGIGKGTVYEYFVSKESLFAEMIKTRIINDYESIHEILNTSVSSCDKLTKFIEFEINNIQKWGKTFQAIVDTIMNMGLKSSALHKTLHEMNNSRFEIVCKIFYEGIQTKEFKDLNPSMATVTFLGALNHFMTFQYGLFPLKYSCLKGDKEWITAEFIEMIFSGIKK